MSNETALERRQPPADLAKNWKPQLSPVDFLQAHKEMMGFVAEVLEEKVDYGLIPNTKKKSLYKAGAERICLGMGARFGRPTILEKEVNNTDPFPGNVAGFCRYVVEVVVVGKTGDVLAAGVGACSSREGKYAKRAPEENTVLKMAVKRACVAAVQTAFGLSGMFEKESLDEYMAREATNEEVFAIIADAAAQDDAKAMRGFIKSATDALSLGENQTDGVMLASDGLTLLFSSKLPEESDWPEGKMNRWGKLCDKVDALKRFENDVREGLTNP